MRPSLPTFIRILPTTVVSPTFQLAKATKPRSRSTPTIISPPITPREEATTRVTLVQTLLQRKMDGLAKEAAGELPKGEGWPVNLRVERQLTKTVLSKVVPEARLHLRDIMKET